MTTGAQKGRGFLLKRQDATSPANYDTVMGLKATSITIDGEQVDITSKDDGGWRTLLANAGNTKVAIKASGVFKNSTTETAIRTDVMQKNIKSFRMVFDDDSYFEGDFQPSNLEYAGEHNQEITYSIQLESSGEVTSNVGPEP